MSAVAKSASDEKGTIVADKKQPMNNPNMPNSTNTSNNCKQKNLGYTPRFPYSLCGYIIIQIQLLLDLRNLVSPK